jgi:hypothetical protein
MSTITPLTAVQAARAKLVETQEEIGNEESRPAVDHFTDRCDALVDQITADSIDRRRAMTVGSVTYTLMEEVAAALAAAGSPSEPHTATDTDGILAQVLNAFAEECEWQITEHESREANAAELAGEVCWMSR